MARRSRVPDLSKRCPRCLLLPEVCLCAEIPRLAVRTSFLVLRHWAERNRTTNSVRWAALALGCEVRDYAAPASEPQPDLDDLGADGTCVLFPGGAPPDASRPPARVVVLDGSWSQARRMIQRVPALRTLPRLSLPASPAPPGAPRLRRPPHAHGMSTLEAMAAALAGLGEPEAAARLARVGALARERVWKLRGVS